MAEISVICPRSIAGMTLTVAILAAPRTPHLIFRDMKKGTGPLGPSPDFKRWSCGSEVKAERKLQIAHVPVLARDLTERVEIRRVGVDAVPVRMIEGVERLGAELKADLLGDREFLEQAQIHVIEAGFVNEIADSLLQDRKSTRLNSSHVEISYAVFCL